MRMKGVDEEAEDERNSRSREDTAAWESDPEEGSDRMKFAGRKRERS